MASARSSAEGKKKVVPHDRAPVAQAKGKGLRQPHTKQYILAIRAAKNSPLNRRAHAAQTMARGKRLRGLPSNAQDVRLPHCPKEARCCERSEELSTHRWSCPARIHSKSDVPEGQDPSWTETRATRQALEQQCWAQAWAEKLAWGGKARIGRRPFQRARAPNGNVGGAATAMRRLQCIEAGVHRLPPWHFGHQSRCGRPSRGHSGEKSRQRTPWRLTPGIAPWFAFVGRPHTKASTITALPILEASTAKFVKSGSWVVSSHFSSSFISSC